ncbi:hypothetical protein OG607_17235 [Streptomyces sp. NBC_01537]|uniref:hypothetical protein n=1 Tax=Streptomyces sp. NBC_01537 TaxID=2903896 RepID=UPI0038687E37
MLTVLRLAGVLGAAFAALFALAGPAAAGGPTSVMLVAPGSGNATAIYATSSDYQALAEATGTDIGAGTTMEPSSLGDREITATWLIHDVSVWKVDRIYPEAAGGIWIRTSGGSGSDGLWHRSPREEALGSLLSRLGLLSGDTGPGLSAPDYPVGSATQPAETKPAAAQAAEPAPSGTTWWPALPGLAAGTALGCGGTLLALRLARRGPHESGPRQQLVDVS